VEESERNPQQGRGERSELKQSQTR
jgi:hypothetical protein